MADVVYIRTYVSGNPSKLSAVLVFSLRSLANGFVVSGPNGGPCIVTDDNVKGQLVLNAGVEAKNPDTNAFQEAVIAKLTDCR